MARSKSPPEPPQIEVRHFTELEIGRGIAQLRRRVEDVKGLDPGQIRHDDAKIRTVEADIRETIRNVFGPRSPEFDDYEHHRIWRGGYNFTDSEGQCQQKFAEGISQTVTILEALISRLEERRDDLEPDQGQAIPSVPTLPGTRRSPRTR